MPADDPVNIIDPDPEPVQIFEPQPEEDTTIDDDSSMVEEDPEITISLDNEKTALYSDEVELSIATPVDPTALSDLFNFFQTTPDIKILSVSGSVTKNPLVTLTLEDQVPLLAQILSIPTLEIKVLNITNKTDPNIVRNPTARENTKKPPRITVRIKSVK